MDHKVLIVGAGFSGLGMGIKLKQQGEDEFMIYERGSELGGTWFYNTYPGAACDVPSLMYSYSFAPKYDWKQPWANHKEIFEYMKDVAYNQNDMHDHFTFGVECTNADWKEEKGLWKVTFRNLSSGAVFTKTTKVLITACGSFSNPNDCPVKGKERFRGKIFHSSRWDHSAELEGKNVVVIGNGCTAAQVVPAVAKKAKHVTQIIRSAHNIVPVPFPNKPTSTLYQNLLLYVPGLHTFLRFLLFCILDLGFLSFVTENRFARGRLDKQCKEHIKKNAPKRYVDMLTPKFEFGAKRRIIDYDYLPALHRDNVDLMLEEMKEINKNGLLLKSGKMIDADVIVYCTGFKVEEYMMPMKVTGENGVDLHDQWESLGFQAYKGGYVHNFPNLVLLMGPNTGTVSLNVYSVLQIATL